MINYSSKAQGGATLYTAFPQVIRGGTRPAALQWGNGIPTHDASGQPATR
jgi:hypothetical protein